MAPLASSDLPGHKLLQEKANLALGTCNESQSIEFTASQPWDALRWKITRTALAMGNLRDGGIIVVGVSQADKGWALVGVSELDLQTIDVDRVIAQVNEYVSKHVDLTVVTHQWQEKTFVVIAVHEFDQTPLVCKKSRESEGLYEGAVYTRPPGMPQTSRLKNAQDMHDLLDLAAEKRSRQFLERARRVGLFQPASSDEGFDQELQGL